MSMELFRLYKYGNKVRLRTLCIRGTGEAVNIVLHEVEK